MTQVSDAKIAGRFLDKGGAVFNITHSDFGAVGDGVSDDHAAIQSAIDACDVAGGGTVYAPGATFAHKFQLLVPDNVVLEGAGYASHFKYTGGAIPDPGGTNQQGQIQFDRVTQVGLRNMRITGDGVHNLVTFNACVDVFLDWLWMIQSPLVGANVNCIGMYDDNQAGVPGISGPYNLSKLFLYPSDKAILAQGRSSGPHTIEALHLSGIFASGINGERTPNPTDGLIKVDLQIDLVTMNGVIVDGAGIAADGIDFEEFCRRVVMSNIVVRNCQESGIHIQDGQSGGTVEYLQLSNFVIENTRNVSPYVGGSEAGLQLSLAGSPTPGVVRRINIGPGLIHACKGEGYLEQAAGADHVHMHNVDIYDCEDIGILTRGTDGRFVNNKVISSFAVRSFRAAAGATGIAQDNEFLATDGVTPVTDNTGNVYIIRRNRGYLTENGGAAQITSGNTFVAVTHNMPKTPDSIQVTATSSYGTAASHFVNTIGATTFRINLNADPGGTVTFRWDARYKSESN
jgi:hypothetical protein